MTGFTPSRNVRVEDDLWDKTKNIASRLGTTQSDIMRAALVTLVEEYDDGKLAASLDDAILRTVHDAIGTNLLARVEELAAEEGVPVGTVVTNALRSHLRRAQRRAREAQPA